EVLGLVHHVPVEDGGEPAREAAADALGPQHRLEVLAPVDAVAVLRVAECLELPRSVPVAERPGRDAEERGGLADREILGKTLAGFGLLHGQILPALGNICIGKLWEEAR